MLCIISHFQTLDIYVQKTRLNADGGGVGDGREGGQVVKLLVKVSLIQLVGNPF